MADDEPENGSRLWRGMRALIFGDDAASTLRDQIEDAIDEAEAGRPKTGDLSPHERQMLRNLLHFGDRTAGEVSVPRGDIVAVSQDVSFDGLVGAFADAEHSRLPVYGDGLDDIIGMIHIKDVYKALNDASRDRTVAGLLRNPLFVPESMGVLELLARMRSDRIHLAIVVDEFGGTEGLVTIEDVVEEIVGDIEDEHDEDAQSLVNMLEDGVWDVDARVELEEVRETIDARLIDEEDDVDTIGGLAFTLAGHLMKPGESVEHASGWRIECVEADTKRVLRLRLYAPEPAEDVTG
ncbi:MAG: hemolysin family protein [Sphingomicrobium sp.]